MEQELFSWTGWDGEPECMQFYDPVLKVDGTCEKPVAEFCLHYRIGDAL